MSDRQTDGQTDWPQHASRMYAMHRAAGTKKKALITLDLEFQASARAFNAWDAFA